MTVSIELPMPCDFHVHLREGEMLAHVAPFTDRQFGLALLMPNTEPPLDTPDRLRAYAEEVSQHLKRCKPLYTFKVTRESRPEHVEQFKKLGAVAGKVYPEGVTNNSHGTGLDRSIFSHPDTYWAGKLDTPGASGPFNLPQQLSEVFHAMEEHGLVLCLHGELPGSSLKNAEAEFLPWVRWLLRKMLKLRVVLEHISSAASCQMLEKISPSCGYRLGATVTLHHLMMTQDDVLGNNFHFCKPVLKDDPDRNAIIQLVKSGHPTVFFGTDSAPHPVATKRNMPSACCHKATAGIFSAPVALPGIVEFMEGQQMLAGAANFLTYNGCRFYQIEAPAGSVRLVRQPWQVKSDGRRDDNKPLAYLDGRTLQWQMA